MNGGEKHRGPVRRVVREEYERLPATTLDGRPYVRPWYRYTLACGHVVVRGTKGRRRCYCGACGETP